MDLWPCLGKFPNVKLRTDSQRRLYGRDLLKADTIYQAESDNSGRITLVELTPKELRPNKVKFEKRGGRTVGVIKGAKFNDSALKQALAEFP
jgi:hypothetical protein